jgi:hypothetical protein
MAADGIGQGRQRQSLAIGLAGPAQHEDVWTPGCKLVREPRFADAWFVDHYAYPRLPGARDSIELRREAPENRHTVDERREPRPGRLSRPRARRAAER